MSFALGHYDITDRQQHKWYDYSEAVYKSEPTQCADKDCDSTFFASQGETSMAWHKICYVGKKRANVMNCGRLRYQCQKCGRTFPADLEETEEWDSDISPAFRNAVINHWLKSKVKSIYEISKMYGINRSIMTEWEDTLAQAFYKNQLITGNEELYFGMFQCFKDDTPHAVMVTTTKDWGSLEGFIRDYSAVGLTGEEKERFKETEKIKIVRYDNAPGIEETLRLLFPKADLIEIPIIYDEYEEEKRPYWMTVVDTVLSHVRKRVNKKQRFNSIMLQMMYNNALWKQRLIEACNGAGFMIYDDIIIGRSTPPAQTSKPYSGNEKVYSFSIPDIRIDEFDLEENLE